MTDIPLGAPFAEILLKIQSNAPPELIFTATALPPLIEASLTFKVPTFEPAIVAFVPESVIPSISLLLLIFKTEKVGFVPPVDGKALVYVGTTIFNMDIKLAVAP